MASSAIFSAPTLLKNNARHLTPSHRSFHGLRPLMPTDTFLWASTTKKSMSKSKAAAVKPAGKMGVRAELNPQIVICLCNGLSLFLGRFVFFNFQRENVAKQGLPKQNGVSHFEAGDVRAQEYINLLKSNDPVGFNIVDVLAWGSIGHIVAYYVLATSSNGYDPSFFG